MTARGMKYESACRHPIDLLYGRIESCADRRPARAALCNECAPGIIDRPDGAVPCLGVPLMHPLQVQSTLQHTPSPMIAHPQHAVGRVLTMLSRTPTSAESGQHTDGLRDVSQTGGSPTCRGLHRRDASQYRYSQPRMVHSRGVVCAHTGHLKMGSVRDLIPVSHPDGQSTYSFPL